jgi:hypothetical protein
LTRRANQAHFAIVEEIIEPAPKIGSGLFVCAGEKFDWRLSKAHGLTVAFESNLTRRANYWHYPTIDFSEVKVESPRRVSRGLLFGAGSCLYVPGRRARCAGALIA